MNELELNPWFPSLPWALKTLVSLSEEQFAALTALVSGPEAYDVTVARCELLANVAKVQPHQASTLLTSLRFLYDRSRDWVTKGTDMASSLRDFLVLTGLETHFSGNSELGYKRLVAVLSRHPVLDRRKKVNWLQTGILETAKSFTSFVEVRPSFTEDRTAIEGFVPAIIFRVVTETESREDRTHIFQLTLEGLTRLRSTIEDAEKKIRQLQSDSSIGERLLK